jgi:hypothetical protein
MIQARAWPVRAMYILIAAALAIGLLITAAPAQKVSGANGDVAAEWTRVDTPTTEDWVLAPDSVIVDYALASAGEVAYAIVDSDYEGDEFLLKSEDGAATWDDLNDELDDAVDIDGGDYIDQLLLVATDWEDPDFVAVALILWDAGATGYYLHVFFSIDGGETFEDAGEVADGTTDFDGPVSDLAVSYEVNGERDIAIAGVMCCPDAALFRCTVTGDSAGAWQDATDYDGWDDDGDIDSYVVTDIIFSPSWETDRTILAVTVEDWSWTDSYCYGAVYLQSGVWGETSAAWNEYADFASAVLIIDNVYLADWLIGYDARAIAGVTLPMDYSGADTDTRVCWVWVNYFDEDIGKSQGEIFRVRDDSVDSVDTQISKMPWLTNVSYLGYIAEGKAIAGVLADSQSYPLYEPDLLKECCEGVQVYRNAGITNMEICCLEWDKACKPPTGQVAMAVSYVSEDKAYAVALGGIPEFEEGAWSVSFDDGDTWNQLSLVDTWIDYLSDVAVSPDCNKMFLVSVHAYVEVGCECDSVWVYADEFPEAGYDEYSGHWLRTWCGELENDWGFLRLAPEETTGDTVYLVDYDTDTIYYNDLETLACWDRGTSTVDYIMDLAVADESTIYALDYYGDVAMSDDHGKALTWTDPVASEVDYGYTIAVWVNNATHVLVGGEDGDVSFSDDGGETFTELDEPTPTDGYVTVAFDTYYNENDAIYAAVDGWDDFLMETMGGIYLWVIGESVDWTDLDAWHGVAYTGLVLDRPSPANPMTSPETGGVLYASFVGEWGMGCGKSGVARCLAPIIEVCCDIGATEWDYLMESDPEDLFYNDCMMTDYVDFEATPDALKICGCLEATSNSKLFALDDGWDYDMDDAEDGAVWTFEDCYAKKGVELTSPVDGFVVPADVCACCNVPFSIKWDRLCDACCYDIQFATDEDFTDIYLTWWDVCPEKPINPSEWIGCDFNPEFTYYWRIRAIQAETDQYIRSWWSEPQSFTVSPTAEAAAIDLVSPVPGATGVAIKNLGFSWNLLASADAFDWVLSTNADLTAAVESKTGLTSTAYTCTKTLSYGTTYYWQVTAYREGSAISTSAIGTFTTAVKGAFCCPLDGLCFDTQAALEAHNAEAHGAAPTPFWVWIVIAIGAVLVIVVIVLIFRTRRV